MTGPNDALASLQLPHLEDAEQVELHLQDVTLGGYYFPAGESARAVLIVHGWGEDASVQADAARHFRNAGLHALSLSLRGSRGSSGCDDYGLRQPHDTLHALHWLKQRSRASRLYLYGYSQGGLVVLLTLALNPPVAAAAVLNAPADVSTFARDTPFAFITSYLNAVCHDGLWQERSPLRACHRITTPVAIVVSEDDRHVPPSHSHDLHACLPGSVLRVIRGAQHQLTNEQREHVWNHALQVFNQHQ